MAISSSGPGSGPGNPTIVELAPDRRCRPNLTLPRAARRTDGCAGTPPPALTTSVQEPDAVTIAPDYTTGGVAFEVFDSNANTAFRTQFDPGDALDAALRIVGAVMRLRRLLTP